MLIKIIINFFLGGVLGVCAKGIDTVIAACAGIFLQGIFASINFIKINKDKDIAVSIKELDETSEKAIEDVENNISMVDLSLKENESILHI